MLQSLTLSNFKNYEKCSLNFHEEFNIFHGDNGMGKTNLIDAIHLLAACKTGASNDKYAIKEDSPFARLTALLNNENSQIVAKLEKGKSKVFEWNQKPYDRLVDHIGKIPVILFVPEDNNLVTGSGEARRQSMNYFLAQMDKQYASALMTFRRILKQRNAILKDGQSNVKQLKSILSIYNQQLLEPSVYIHESRAKFTALITPFLIANHQHLSENKEEPTIEYKSKVSAADFIYQMERKTDSDIQYCRTQFGIHRDDLVFKLDGKEIKHYGSQGQKKTFLIAYKFAQFQYFYNCTQRKSVFLLDDIFDKLDNHRVKKLLMLCKSADLGQVFMTHTDGNNIKSLFEELNLAYKSFYVENGVCIEN